MAKFTRSKFYKLNNHHNKVMEEQRSYKSQHSTSHSCECKRCEQIGHDNCKYCDSITDAFLKVVYHTQVLPWP